MPSEQAAIERDFALHDPFGDREHELHGLALGAVDHFAAKRRQLFDRLGEAAQHRLGARGGGLGAGPLALRVALA